MGFSSFSEGQIWPLCALASIASLALAQAREKGQKGA
jgi:hypothetical protein